MKPITVTHEGTSLVEDAQLTQLCGTLEPEVRRLREARSRRCHTPYGSICLPDDKHLRDTIRSVAEKVSKAEKNVLVVIGIGGSNLGALAVHAALNGLQYNEHHPNMPVYFVDTVDPDATHEVCQLIEQKIAAGYHIILNIVSKSGTTTETVANAHILLHLLQTHDAQGSQHSIVITSDEGSKLWNAGINEKWKCLFIPETVGGRFSVFSSVGLFPLHLLGVDIEQLHTGADAAVEQCTATADLTNPAAVRAAILFAHYSRVITLHNMFLFSPSLEGVGRWYRQLIGESIGKEKDKDDKTVNVGITPITSIGSTDLHTVGQLYLGGPNNMLTTFVGIAHQAHDPAIPDVPALEELIGTIQGKSLGTIMQAIMEGTQRAYTNASRPFTTLVLPEKSAWHLGYLLQMHMIEIIYLGFLLNVNPFDQPEVERYKDETREILAHE